MASLIGVASSPFPTQTSHLLPSRSNKISSLIQLKVQLLFIPSRFTFFVLSNIDIFIACFVKRDSGRRLLLLRVNCSSRQVGDAETESESKVLSPDTYADSSISAYNWCAALGGIGFLETSYLTFLKFTDSEAFCPAGAGGSCSDILNSSYSDVFGNIPRYL